MLILIDGIDRTGKSSLASRLRSFTGGEVIHFSRPREHPLREYTDHLVRYTPPRDTVIMDRSHIGESVWPIVFSRASRMDVAVRRWLSMLYMSRGAVLLHAVREVTPDLAGEYEAAGEPLHNTDDIRLAQHLFNEAVGDCGLPAYQYAHEGWPGQALHEAARRAVIAGESLGTRMVGSVAPRVLIVVKREGSRPFPCMPYEDTDARFLMAELDDWRQVALTDEPTAQLWHSLGRPEVVTLGVVDVDGVPCGSYGTVGQFRRHSPPGTLRETIRRHL